MHHIKSFPSDPLQKNLRLSRKVFSVSLCSWIEPPYLLRDHALYKYSRSGSAVQPATQSWQYSIVSLRVELVSTNLKI